MTDRQIQARRGRAAENRRRCRALTEQWWLRVVAGATRYQPRERFHLGAEHRAAKNRRGRRTAR